jgi:hypothetical protein
MLVAAACSSASLLRSAWPLKTLWMATAARCCCSRAAACWLRQAHWMLSAAARAAARRFSCRCRLGGGRRACQALQAGR